MKLNNKSAPLKNPLCVALDVDDISVALKLAADLADTVGGFKIGPRLVFKYGAQIIKQLSHKLPVFVDCKFFDIPSTMEASVKAAADAGASLITIHALSGIKAMKALSKIQSQYQDLKILPVTVLTSWTDSDLQNNFKFQTTSDLVKSLCSDIQNAGLNSVVCSALELEIAKSFGFYSVTPGIRFDLQETSDQSRTMTPMEAIKKGSNVLVVGRPIIEAPSPREAAIDFMTAIY
jgi:orotidine-5'-phosphate decarboxylase